MSQSSAESPCMQVTIQVEQSQGGLWRAKIRTSASILPEVTLNRFSSRAAAVDAAVEEATAMNQRQQGAFASWISETKARLNSD